MGYSVADIGFWWFNGVDGRSRAETMIQPVILEKLAELPESLQTEVLHYIEYLIEKQAKNLSQEKPTKRGGLGIWKDKIWMSDDFDEPLEDLKDYM
ncbi:DUF2281 domain-containing protein [Microcoleus sp. N9_B2]|uniref:type II toxin-antitoxin system VapB family antitoxin n=1 Tax=unclassified Microcoleus TaxID=2642155 RepID=UPI002FD24194